MTLAPEEIELNKKRAVLERLKDRLANCEEGMADLRAALQQFEAQYTMEVGRLYADLDEIEAQIAEEEFKLVPDDEEIKKKAAELRRAAEESAERAFKAAETASAVRQPTLEAKKAYHLLARAIHPDLALDAREKEKRHGLMARLNEAYSAGDQSVLNKLVEDFRSSPDLVEGDSVADDLVRAIRQISQVAVRLKQLRLEKFEAENSELFILSERMLVEAAAGRNMIKQVAARTLVQIKKSERRLANLRNVNAAAEQHIRDEYDMDISEFRQTN